MREFEQRRHGIEQRLQSVAAKLERGLKIRCCKCAGAVQDQLQEAQFDLQRCWKACPGSQ